MSPTPYRQLRLDEKRVSFLIKHMPNDNPHPDDERELAGLRRRIARLRVQLCTQETTREQVA